MKYIITLALVLTLVLVSCQNDKGSSSSNHDKELDSLRMLSVKKDKEMNNLVSILIDIDENIQLIKEKEQLITLSVANNDDGAQSLEKRINNDIKVIYDLMLKNKEHITLLEKQLQQSGSNNTNINKLVKRLNSQLKDKTIEIIKLQKQLEGQSLQIADLNFTIDGLQSVVDSLEGLKIATQQELDETIEQLYRAYYVFGSKKELKAENILSSDGFLSKKKVLSDDFSKDYFTTIDYRELDSLNLYMPKAKLLTNHPKASYTLELDDNEAMILKITDKDAFWSISRHLVIQVN